jgi:hypothetical protein
MPSDLRDLLDAAAPAAPEPPAVDRIRRRIRRRRAARAGGGMAVVLLVALAAITVLQQPGVRFEPAGPDLGPDGAPLQRWTRIPDGPLAGGPATGVWAEGVVVFHTEEDGRFASYEPTSGEWRELSQPPGQGLPGAGMVWTGEDVVLWRQPVQDDPIGMPVAIAHDLQDAWRALPTPPIAPRSVPAMVWTGEEVIVWGGEAGELEPLPADGAAYNPETDSWRILAAAPLDGLADPVAVWTGSEVIIGGGEAGDGGERGWAAYDPVADAWERLPPPGLPMRPRSAPLGAWTADRLVIAHRSPELEDGFGATFDPATRTWRAIADAPAVDTHRNREAAGTGNRLLLWGADDEWAAEPTALAYDPRVDLWDRLPEPPLPALVSPAVVWARDRLVVWGGTALDGDGGAVPSTAGASYGFE